MTDDNGQFAYEERIRTAWQNEAHALPSDWINDFSISDQSAFRLVFEQWGFRDDARGLSDYLASDRQLTKEQRQFIARVMEIMQNRLHPQAKGRGRPTGAANKERSPLTRAVYMAREAFNQWTVYNQGTVLSPETKTKIISNIIDNINANFNARIAVEDVKRALAKGNKTPLI